MGRKDRKIILLAQCLVNPYCRVHLLGQNFGLSHELLNYLMSRRVGIIQYPCPETTAMGLRRNPQGRQQYDNIFFRAHCKELLRVPMLMVREFIENGYRLVAFVGLEGSPTCGLHWGRHKVNRYGTESPVEAEAPQPGEPPLLGIMAEILSEELAQDGLSIPFLEFPTRSQPGSPQRQRFWEDLRRAVEPRAQPGYETATAPETPAEEEHP
jgi:predicted secreted protein